MTEAYLQLLLQRIGRSGDQLAPGLTDAELAQIEERYDIHFPPDLRSLLQRALPVGDMWVNWRDDSEATIRDWLDRPVDGICFDIEHSGFWRSDWGPRPLKLQDALQLARTKIAEAPKLIPINPGRYIPDEPHATGNPIFSVMQTDIIHYGYDLTSFFMNQWSDKSFSMDRLVRLLPDWTAKSPRPIRFWDDFVYWPPIMKWHDKP